MRSYYLILGVPRTESSRGIRAAYRDRAKALHPDRSGGDDEAAFRELQEAYEVLSNPQRRRRYDAELAERQRPAPPLAEPRRRPPEPLTPERRRAEPLIPEADEGRSLFRDFRTIRPSAEALRERVTRNFTDARAPKSEHAEALTVEIELTPEQAAQGVTVPLGIPVFLTCPECGGAGSVWTFPCHACAQQGVVEDERVVRVELPPGVRTGAVTELPLTGLGIENLYLRVLVRVVA